MKLLKGLVNTRIHLPKAIKILESVQRGQQAWGPDAQKAYGLIVQVAGGKIPASVNAMVAAEQARTDFEKLVPQSLPIISPPTPHVEQKEAPDSEQLGVIDRITNLMRFLIELNSEKPAGFPSTFAFLGNLNNVRDLPAINDALKTQITEDERFQRTDETLNGLLKAEGADLRVFIRQPAGPIVVDGVDLFQPDHIVFSSAKEMKKGKANLLLFQESEDEITNLPSRLESARDQNTMMVRLNAVAETFEEALSIAFDNDPLHSEKQRNLARKALKLYGITSRKNSSAGRQRFIDERAECLIALMLAESSMELSDHAKLMDSGFYSLSQFGVFLGKLINQGDNHLAALHKFLLGLHVLKYILETFKTDRNKQERMLYTWAVCSSCLNLKRFFSGGFSAERVDKEIARVKKLADTLTNDIAIFIANQEMPRKVEDRAFEMAGSAQKNCRYSSIWAKAIDYCYRYMSLNPEQKNEINDFLNRCFEELTSEA